MNAQIQKLLLDNEKVTPDQIKAAEKFASDSHLSLGKALVGLNYLTPKDLGNCYSIAYSLPYVPIANLPIAAGTTVAISADCARHWKVFPIRYDTRSSLLTLAVSSLEQAQQIEKIFHLLMEPHDVAFTIAPEFEIEGALAAVSEATPQKGTASPSATPATKHAEITGPDGKPVKQKLSIPIAPPVEQKKTPDRKVEKDRPARPPKEPERAEPPTELLSSLTSAISLLVTAHLGANQKEVGRVRTRARYCQLTASRLNLTPAQTTKVVLAAWLSALENRRDIIRQMATPFNLESIIFPHESSNRQEIESLVLTLVRCYQGLEEESQTEARDVNTARRALHLRWSGASDHQDLVETFLQVLMDEQYLDKLGKKAGTVLLVEIVSTPAGQVETTLRRAGYEVVIAAGMEAARDVILSTTPPDLMVLNAETSAREMLAFCKQIRTDLSAASIPIMVIIANTSEIRGTEFLRAGAEDILPLPVDVDLLYWKVEKLLTSSAQPAAKKGVSGSLADMCFSDLIQVLSASARNMEIVVKRMDQEGRLFLKDGNVIHAQAGNLTGEQAFYHLMSWQDGEFSMTECSEFPESTITSSTMSLLMEGARLADESAAV